MSRTTTAIWVIFMGVGGVMICLPVPLAMFFLLSWRRARSARDGARSARDGMRRDGRWRWLQLFGQPAEAWSSCRRSRWISCLAGQVHLDALQRDAQGLAAVQDDRLPGDVRGIGAGQEADHPRDVRRLGEPAEREFLQVLRPEHRILD